MTSRDVLVLSRAELEKRLDPTAAALAIEDAYKAASAGEIELPPVGHLTFPAHEADCHIKFGHQRDQDVFVIKVATGFPLNDPDVAPVNNGAVLVLSAQTGELRAVLHDQMYLTDVRTGIGGAIASRALARSDASRLLVVGTGIQAAHQMSAHRALLGRELDISVWGRSFAKAEAVAAHCGATAVSDLAQACAAADIIVTVTAAQEPVVLDPWVAPGTHVTAVGADAPGKHELDPALLARSGFLVVDSRSQCLDHGESSVLPDQHATRIIELGQILSGEEAGRTNDDELTVADLTGIAAQDIAIASVVLGSGVRTTE